MHAQPVAHRRYIGRTRQRHIQHAVAVGVERCAKAQQVEQVAGQEAGAHTRPEALHRHHQIAVGKAARIRHLPQIQIRPLVIERQGKVIQIAPNRLRVDDPFAVERVVIRRCCPEL